MSAQPLNWIFSESDINWEDLSHLYRIAPLGEKKPEDLKICFSNSKYKCFIFSQDQLVGAGRALADGVDCSYICDIAVHPDYQGRGLGREMVTYLRDQSIGHRKIILYTFPGTETFYEKLGFRRMKTALAIFENYEEAMKNGFL